MTNKQKIKQAMEHVNAALELVYEVSKDFDDIDEVKTFYEQFANVVNNKMRSDKILAELNRSLPYEE